jgi:YidC/Oxa1 family membrane protein insertase
MQQTVNGGNKNVKEPPKEMSMEIRLLLAFLLMGAVMFLTPYFFKTPTPPPGQKTTKEAATAPQQNAAPAAGQPVAGQKAAAPAQEAEAPSAPATSEQAQPPFVIDNGVFKVAFSNQGATVRSWALDRYKGNDNKPLELMNTVANVDFPFSLYFPAEKPTAKVNERYYTQTADPDGLGVTYEFSDGHTTVRKVFRFQKNSYLSQVSAEVTLNGQPIPSLLQWRGGFGDLTVANPSNAQRTLFFNVADNKLTEQNAKAAKDGPVTASGNFSFAGIADQYFAAVFLPDGAASMTKMTFSDPVRTALDEKAVPFPGVAVTDGAANHFSFFVGPKDLDLLRKINPKLVEVVDFGWWSFLAKPLFLIVNWINDSFVHNFGWSIVLVTVLINFVLFPVKMTNFKSMRKMQALKPQIDAINAKYKNISMRDPKKAEQQQETMELYKKYGVNPMGGCLPSLIQLALVYPFYKVFMVAVEMRGANWLWVTDLSQPEHLAIKILPIIMIGSQFLYQKMMPSPSTDPNQARMMMLMPLIFGFMFYNLPSGLVLYYLTSNLVNMGQQWFFNHTESAKEAVRSVQPPAKKKNGRK